MSDPISRASDAQRLLDDPIFKEAFAGVEAAIIAKLRAEKTERDPELLMAWRLLPKIRDWLIGQVQLGKIELEDRERKTSRK